MMGIQPNWRVFTRKKPTTGRFLGAAVLAVLAWLAGGSAQAEDLGPSGVLTEARVVTLALERADLKAVIEGEVAVEVGRAREGRAYANPTLAYSREQTFGDLGTGEDYLTIGQTIDLGGRRGLQGDAGALRAEAARERGDGTRLAVATEARLRFGEAQHQRARIAALEGWRRRLSEVLDNVVRREKRGISAVYDRRRLEREVAVAKARLETAIAASERADARLGAFIGSGPEAASLRLPDSILPTSDPLSLPLLTSSGLSRPDLAALDHETAAAAREADAASRWWLPEVTLEGGWKGIDFKGQTRSDGFVVGASLAIPLWDQSDGAAEVARGKAQAARGRGALLASELTGELAGARAEAVRTRQAAADFQREASAANDELLRIASLAYDGGEMGLLALLDAYRGHAEDAITFLDMAHAAHRARVAVDSLAGIGHR